jgi:hypothetical protein
MASRWFAPLRQSNVLILAKGGDFRILGCVDGSRVEYVKRYLVGQNVCLRDFREYIARP